MATVTWSLLADFDRNGSYEFDLTPYIDMPSHNVRVSRGIGRDGKPQASKLSVSLTNRDGTFTPSNSASALYGLMDPGVPVRLTATASAVPYTVWTGYAMTWKVGWSVGTDPVCQVECDDIFAVLRDADVVNVATVPRDTDGALIAIMDALGLVAGDRNFDDGVQDFPLHFAVGQNPLEAMMAAVASEMGGLLYPAADGRIRFESRSSRLGTTVDDTWGDGTSVKPVATGYELNPREYYTSVEVRATTFVESTADTPIFEFSEELTLTAGQVWERTFQANSAYLTLTTIAANTDYLANATSGGGGTDKTSALTVTVTDLGGGRFTLRLENTDAGTIYVTKMRLRGHPVLFFSDRAAASFSLSVPNLKAGRVLQFDVPFSGDTGGKIRDYAYQELRVGRYPYPTLTLSFRALFDAEHTALLSAELGDLIRYADLTATIDGSARVDDWWYIEAIEYGLPGDWFGEVFDVKVTLIPSYVYRNVDKIAFDTFNRANVVGSLGTSFSEDAWTRAGNMDITSNAARANSDTLQMPVLSLGAAAADQVVEASFAAIGAGDEVGLVFRDTDASNQYRAYVTQGTNLLKLEKNVAGVVTQLGASVAYTVGTTAEMQVIIQSTRIRVKMDRKTLLDTTDASLTTGNNAGLFLRNANATTTADNFYSEAL